MIRSGLLLRGGIATVAVALACVTVLGGSPDRSAVSAVVAPSPDVFEGARLYVDPDSPAARAAAAASRTDPAGARLLRKVADGATADWFGDQSPAAVTATAGSRVATIRAAGALPVLVAYNLPFRDCGSFSAGGTRSAAEYRAWVRGFAAGLGHGPAAVIVEPDALATMGCLPAGRQAERLTLLRYAVSTLTARPGVAVYLDAGHAGWLPPQVMAQRLRDAGVGHARGFALNVSAFGSTAAQVAYGQEISAAVGGAHFVIDTSRNGRGPAPGHAWCNPPGQALGVAPGTPTDDPLVDAYLWVKHPGFSDGTCNGGPPAGQWWPAYARQLAGNVAG